MEASLVWYHTDEGVLPAGARDPWIKTSTEVAIITDGGLEVIDATGGQRHVYHRQCIASDTSSSPPRVRDVVEVQALVRGVTSTPSWTSGASPIGLWIDDGSRCMGVSIGSDLAFINPYTGDVLGEIATNHPWLIAATYLLRKVGTERWELFVDGKLFGSLAYVVAETGTSLVAIVGFGCLDIAGQARAVFQAVEAGCNRTIPAQWKVTRAFASMPGPLQSRWTAIARAALRATVGLVEQGAGLLWRAWLDTLAARMVWERIAFTGEVDPSTTAPAWTVTGTISIARGRIRMDNAGVSEIRLAVPLTTIAALPPETEHTAACTWTVRSYTPDAAGRVGPYIRLVVGARQVFAQLYVDATGATVWALTTVAVTGALVLITGANPWPVNALQAHRVEILAQQDIVILLVDHQIVDRLPLELFPTITATPGVRFAVSAAPSCVVDLEQGEITRRLTDRGRRRGLEGQTMERLIFHSGCEYNEELDAWNGSRFEVHQLRGTTNGILAEVKRLACSRKEVFVTNETQPLSWYLERSWPEVTPIFLDSTGAYVDVYVEFGFHSPNFTPVTLADLLTRYLLPVSVEELMYWACIATVLTTHATAVSATVVELDVTDSQWFAVGDSCTLRDELNTRSEPVTILSVPSATKIRVGALTFFVDYDTGSVLRKALAHS
jgi:hypothetical protein